MNTVAAIEFLRQQQRPDGSFAGWASPTVLPFVPERQQPTIFPTALILNALQAVIGTDDIRAKAADFLKGQISPDGSWNYWDASSQARINEPYPDDLDDTACALSALIHQDTDWVSGALLGKFARLLVSVEQQPGGPYSTWLIDTAKAPSWRNFDIGVNANIGYALSLHDVYPSGLKAFIENAIATSQFQSTYYVGEIPIVYFLSRWVKNQQLIEKANLLLTTSRPQTPLQKAMLLSAGCRLGLARKQLRGLATDLQAEMLKDHWAADALYLDPAYNGQQHYSGSEALTTAYVLEAITLYAGLAATSSSKIKAETAKDNAVLSALQRGAHQIPSETLRRRYIAAAERVSSGPNGSQLTNAASQVVDATGWDASNDITTSLNLANLNGWIAYTLYDDILDGDTELQKINVANVALRRSYDGFSQTEGLAAGFKDHVRQVFDTIDSANDWEQRKARAIIEDGKLQVKDLPKYGDYNQLAERSLGHSLPALALFSQQHGTLDAQPVTDVQDFYKHFLIARQLNDDAHDWESDLRAGQLSAVVTLILTDYKQTPYEINLDSELDKLREHFWQRSLPKVAQLIRHHLSLAKESLDEIQLSRPEIFNGWLEALEQAVAAAEKGRNDAQQFMDAYEGKHE